ncbi:MAG: NrtA/SsuA/CpmA family ABC transporter substrate-binding protein [Candidatus Thiodiazotropha sp. (ex Dulcina madagascariensis)]|nr:NrtA/SsuA/CpmA family ABC transporter substrate-binding protein [Candidatus Thiodiazotropha sp. (ex Dulcina madagascariensis)]
MKKQAWWFVIVGIIIAGVLVFPLSKPPITEPQIIHKIVIALSTTPPAGLIFIAHEKGYFTDQGLDVTLLKVSSGKTALKAVLEKRADMGATSENPIMHAVLKNKPVRLLATILSTGRNYVVLGRKDRGISSMIDLKGKKVGVTPGTNSEFLLEAMLTLNGVNSKEIEKVPIPPTQITDAIVKGKVDAISSWNPHILMAQKQLRDNYIVFYGREIYTATFNLATLAGYVKDNPLVIEKVLRALMSAEECVKKEPQQARSVLAKHIRLSKSMLDELWEIYNYEVTLDQTLITTMESQAKWAIHHGMSNRKTLPDFLGVIYLDGMNAVKPKAVTVIH